MAFHYITPVAFRARKINQAYLRVPNPTTISDVQAELRANSIRIDVSSTRTVSKYGNIGERLPDHRYNVGPLRQALPATSGSSVYQWEQGLYQRGQNSKMYNTSTSQAKKPSTTLRPVQESLLLAPINSFSWGNDLGTQDGYDSNVSPSNHQMPTQCLEILAPRPVRDTRHALISWERLLNNLDEQSSQASGEQGDLTGSQTTSTRTQNQLDKYPVLSESCDGPSNSQGSLNPMSKFERYRALLETCLAPKDTPQKRSGASAFLDSELTRPHNHPPSFRSAEAYQDPNRNRSRLFAILNH